MVDSIRMPFGVVTAVGWGMGVLDGGGYRRTRRRRGSFMGDFGSSHCNQSALCCVVVWKCVNRSGCRLAWWVWSPRHWCIRWGPRAWGEGGVSEIFRHLRSHSFEWAEWRIVRPEMYSTRAWKVYYISVQTIYRWNLFHWLSKYVLKFEVDAGVWQRLTKM